MEARDRRQQCRMLEKFERRKVTDVDISIKYAGKTGADYESKFFVEVSEVQREVGNPKIRTSPYRIINEPWDDGTHYFYGTSARNRAEVLKRVIRTRGIEVKITRDDTQSVREFQYKERK